MLLSKATARWSGFIFKAPFFERKLLETFDKRNKFCHTDTYQHHIISKTNEILKYSKDLGQDNAQKTCRFSLKKFNSLNKKKKRLLFFLRTY